MSDFLAKSHLRREPLEVSFSDASNPAALDGIEFIEYATAHPQALGRVLEMMGFKPVARHRSREVLLYRQGELNVIVNAHAEDVGSSDVPVLSAIALRVRDARAAYDYALDCGAWDIATRAEVMELHIPAIHGVGDSRIYFVDRYREFSIYDVDFVPIPGVDQQPPATAGIHFFGIVQYIGASRSADWIHFYQTLFGALETPREERYGILPRGTLIRFPAISAGNDFMMQLIEPDDGEDEREYLQRIGLGVPDVLAAVAELRGNGIEFVETPATHTEPRGAISKTYEQSVAFELVLSQPRS
jgi:4-hydroxyphenylpyruvate dioxygenase